MSGSSGGGSSDHRSTPSKGGRRDTYGTVSRATLQQADVYSGSYAVPEVFGGQTLTFQHGGGSAPRPPSVSGPTAAPSQPPQAAGSINSTANHMLLDNDPYLHHPSAVTSVAWGGATIASPAVLFGQHESVAATSALQFAQLGQQLLPQQQLHGFGGIGSSAAPAALVPPAQLAGIHPTASLKTTTSVDTAVSTHVVDGGVAGGGAMTSVLLQHPPPLSDIGGAVVPLPLANSGPTFTFNGGGGGGGGGGGIDPLTRPVFQPGFNPTALQNQQQPAPVFTTRSSTGFPLSAFVGEQQQQQKAAPVFTIPPSTGLAPSAFGGEQQQPMVMPHEQQQQQQQQQQHEQQQQQQPGTPAASITAAFAPFPPQSFLRLNPV
ncbi:unnamed protein product, partial [Ectocarpus sp. 12 AP-2014]